jgi:hypothetical protein
MGKGSVYRQPWPYDFGNVWGTGFNGNKPSGNVGYMWEDWSRVKATPYKWQEYDANNSLQPVQPGFGKFTRDEENLRVWTCEGGDINMFFQGPNMKPMRNYTISGKMKFSDASAEFGIDFYSQWPNQARKYTLMRKADGLAYLYYYSDSATAIPLDTEDIAHSDVMNTVNAWYNYEITVSNSESMTTILGKIWNVTGPKPDGSGIIAIHMSGLTQGVVGLTSHTGNGNRYWGPLKVTSSETDSGAYLAFEDFKEDTIVDVRPYTPAAVHPDYTVNQFTRGQDSSGFVLDTTNGTSLIYRHKPGVEYPVTCRIAPATNLDWRDYEFSGTIVKPAGDVYDSAGVGVIFYAKDSKNYYALKVNGKAHDSTTGANKFIITRCTNGVEDSIWHIDSLFQGSKDTMNFRIKVLTRDFQFSQDSIQDTIKDGEINIQPIVWGAGSNKPPYPIEHPVETQDSRKVEGLCGVIFNYSGTTLTNANNTNGIRVKNIKIQKAGD